MRWVKVLVLAAFCVAIAADFAKAADRPNVLFVLIDDMGYGDLSCFGGERVQTPQIDRLAKEGIRFTQFYVNAPICSPSRVAFLTGQYPNRWRITSFLATRKEDRERGIVDWLDPAAPTLARAMQSSGYRTAHVGKWHMGGQRDIGDAPLITQYGFDASLTSFEGLGERVLPKFANDLNHGPTRMNADLGGGPIHWVDRSKVTGVFVDRTLEEIDAAARQSKPFYINLWLDDVHSPVQAPAELRGDNSPLANYLGVMTEMDRQLGRLFERIRGDAKLRNNTVILLCSDNGPESGLGITGGLRGSKGQLYEGGVRSPLIVWAPGIMESDKAGSTNGKTLLAAMDFSPSVLALAGVPSPMDAKPDGRDMSAALSGKSADARGSAVMWLRPPDRPGPAKDRWPDLAIRDGDWKLLVMRDGSRPQLYDLASDERETKNLADRQPEIVDRLSREVIAWEKATSARP